MKAELIGPADPRWSAVLARTRHDAFQIPEYTEFSARHEGGSPAAFYVESNDAALLAPVLLRDVPAGLGAPAGWRDAVSPYGYAGPLLTDGWNPEMFAGAVDAIRTMGAANDLVAAFFRMHPLLSLATHAFEPLGLVEPCGEVVYVDLTLLPEEIEKQRRRSERQQIRALNADGFVCTVNDWDRYGRFGAVYRSTMDRVDAAGSYFFSDAYFTELRAALGSRLHFASVIAPDGELAAGGVFLMAGDLVQYHLSATADAYVRRSPSKLIIDCMIRWAKSEGGSWLNLGGGVGGRADSLRYYKLGFSPLLARFDTVRMVLDDERYARLCAAAGAPESDRSGFFPAYRRPVAEVPSP